MLEGSQRAARMVPGRDQDGAVDFFRAQTLESKFSILERRPGLAFDLNRRRRNARLPQQLRLISSSPPPETMRRGAACWWNNSAARNGRSCEPPPRTIMTSAFTDPLSTVKMSWGRNQAAPINNSSSRKNPSATLKMIFFTPGKISQSRPPEPASNPQIQRWSTAFALLCCAR